MKVLDLFSGIGGFSLGLERAGMETVAFCEIDPYCRKVLTKHWSDVPIFEDIRKLKYFRSKQRLCEKPAHPKIPEEVYGPIDVVCGGFPCQDVSDAARGVNNGIQGARSSLWFEMARVVAESVPEICLVENVDGAAWKRWLPVVRRSLFELGYSSLPIRMRASDIGAPFKGSRIYVAATNREGKSARAFHAKMAKLPELAESCWIDWGEAPPRTLGVANGVRDQSHRLRATGNSVVPQVVELIGRAIMA